MYSTASQRSPNAEPVLLVGDVNIRLNRPTDADAVQFTDLLCPIHTADADETKLFCRVGGVNTNSQLVGDSFVVSSV